MVVLIKGLPRFLGITISSEASAEEDITDDPSNGSLDGLGDILSGVWGDKMSPSPLKF
jgi:hypothetical protein